MKRLIIALTVIFAASIYVGLYPLREFYRIPVYTGDTALNYPVQQFYKNRKSIFIVAYNKGTEIFDLIAPFYLFNLTNQANVFIIAPEKKPVALMKGFFLVPHYTFTEIDFLQIEPSALIIPNLSAVDKKEQDQSVLNWIRKKYSPSIQILSVCAGSFTAASTGLYDGKAMTTHASEMKMNTEQFNKPKWVSGVTYTKDGNLYSTAGVSNAVEGSLAVIRNLFGEETMKAVMDSIKYPYTSLKKDHKSLPIRFSNKRDVIRKILFERNKKIGVLLQDNIDEFTLAAVLDAYHRTFPASLRTFTINKKFITSKYGLTIIPTGLVSDIKKLDELHVLNPGALAKSEERYFSQVQIIKYEPSNREYIFNVCLQRIGRQYGQQMQTVVKRLLDYN